MQLAQSLCHGTVATNVTREDAGMQALHDNPQLLSLLQHGLSNRSGDAEDVEEDDDHDATPGNMNCRVN